MKQGLIAVSVVAATLAVSGCKIEPDWERKISAANPDEQRVEWLKDMRALDSGNVLTAIETIIPGVNRNVDVLLAEVDRRGDVVWQRVYDLGENESIAELKVRGDRRYLLVNTPEGSTVLLALSAGGEVLWTHRYQDGQARSLEVVANRIYITGQRTQVLSDAGTLLLSMDHQGERFWDVEVGLLGDFYLAGAEGTAAYDARGNQLWYQAANVSAASQQVDLLWREGVLFVARSQPEQGIASLSRLNVLTGEEEWYVASEAPSWRLNVDVGPVLLESADNGDLLLVQSYAQGRQISAYNERYGKLHWSERKDTGVVRDIARLESGDLVVTGSGVSELYDAEGNRYAWSLAGGEPESTTGEVEVVGSHIIAGGSYYRDGEVAVYLTHFNNP